MRHGKRAVPAEKRKVASSGEYFIILKLTYNEKTVPYEHDFSPLDLSNIRADLTPREKEAIEGGLKLRAKYIDSNNEDKIFSKVSKDATISSLDLGSIKIVFFPNEIFSEYLNGINLEERMLVSYSNGYGPYVLPIDFKYITYEMIMDTLTPKTKKELIEVFKTI